MALKWIPTSWYKLKVQHYDHVWKHTESSHAVCRQKKNYISQLNISLGTAIIYVKQFFCFFMTCYHITFQSSYIECSTTSEVHGTSMFMLSLLILFLGFGTCGSVLQCQCVGGIFCLNLWGQGIYG